MRRPQAILAVALMLMTSLAAASPSDAPHGTGTGASDTPHAIQVPVIFEGVRYEPAQFNALVARIPQDLHFAVVAGQEDRMYAFRSLDQVRAFLRSRREEVHQTMISEHRAPSPLSSHIWTGS